MAAQPDDALELDEMWTFVRHRRRGVIRRWLARCRRTRQIVAYALGPRDDATARQRHARIPAAYRQGLLYPDQLESYHNVLPSTNTAPPTPKVPPTPSNASITPSVSAWGGWSAKPYPFPNAPTGTNSSSASFFTAITWNAITFQNEPLPRIVI